MTASRLFHVGQVTSEAVEQLHRWVECIWVRSLQRHVHRWASVFRSGHVGGCGTAAQVSEYF